jgi:hypothetical protein
MTTLHETHVCRDCGAEITIPYARPASAHADVDVDRLVRTVESVQAALTTTDWQAYDHKSWEIFVGHQMQRILDVLAPAEETPAEALNHAIHDATGYKP